MAKLTEAEKSQLEVIANSADSRLAKRAMILLMSETEAQPQYIAKEVELTPRTVKHWLREFEKEGLSIFPHRANGDVFSALPVAVEVEINEPITEEKYRPNVRKADLQPTDAFAEAGRKILKFHFNRMLKVEAETKTGQEMENLHEMRVAIRRMRAAFRVFGYAYARKKTKLLKVGLQATGQALGPVRDLDVFIKNLQDYQQSLAKAEQASMQVTLELWAKKYRKARRQMVTYLNSKQYASFKQDFKKFVETEGQGVKSRPEGSPTPYQLRHVAASLIYEAYEHVRSYETVLENAPVATLHQLRIAFKRLRYLLEFLQEVLGEEVQLVINEVKTMQDHLGNLQDAEVANTMLKAFIGEVEPLKESQAEAASSDPLARYMELRMVEHQQLLVSFPQAWANFNRAEVKQALAGAVSVL